MAETKVYELKIEGVDMQINKLVELQDKIKQTNAQLKELSKTEGKSEEQINKDTQERIKLTNTLTDQKQQLNKLNAEIRNNQKAQQLATKEAEAAEGSIEQLSLQLSRLKKDYRELSKEEREGAKGRELLNKIQATDKEVKSLDASMGNYQRNVGNYKSATEALGSAFTKVAGIVGGVVVAFKGFEKVAMSTQLVGDQLNITITQGKDVLDLFTRALLTDGLGIFEGNLRRVVATAKEYAEIMDEMFERQNSVRLIEAENAEELINLELQLKNTSLSYEQRMEAAERYRELSAETYAIEKKMAEDANEAEAARFLSSINLAESEKANLDKLLTDYARLSDTQKEAMYGVAELVKKSGSIWGNVRNKADDELDALRRTQPELVKMGELWYQYNLSNDKATQRYVDTLVRAREAQSAYLRENKRIETSINTISGQLEKQNNPQGAVAVPIGLDTPAEVVKQFDEEYFATKPMIEQSLSASPIAIPLAPLVDATTSLADMLSQRTYGELGIDNLWVKLLGLDNTLYSEEINAQIEEYSTMLKEGIVNIGTEAWGAYLTAREESIDREMELEKKKNDALADSEKKALEGRLSQGLISQKKYEKELAKIDEERAANEEALEREAFNRKKRLNVSDALMKGALALLDVWKNYAGDPIGLAIQLALTAAGTGVQVAAIRNQKFAKGGRIVGASHSAGGVKGWLAGQNIELEGGEVVINKRSAALFGEELSAINSYNGYGKKFARGGVLGTEKYMPAPIPSLGGGGFNYKDLGEAINTAIDSKLQTLRVVVTEGDITTAQHNVLRAQVAAEF